ncbi:RNA-directed DNA polymerase [Gregarina niphandrodes]|uniref:RNA-directed DNA polymerase n=1 Tax=Gregarina niphandrodes TaxID=110365 RepID=A0A023AYQ8_GRENI|nr:RNA-directed DNA polymerase [Gregarina niphandrodes]EZG43405.1 RNA-directed DNA polymerase [Gregarina niphandrodes]|eukprot:XP_011133363.1 RNA-directed DNA polymerase [Gregarina niphandrodes]
MRHSEPELQEELEVQVKKQLELGVIRSSKSEWAAAPHFVKKKTGEWRCVLDYQRLNESMVADSYPIPRIWNHLRTAASHRICWFWNVPIAEESKDLTAFVTAFGLFEFNVIPFGIKNSPAEFQRAMDASFEEVLDSSTLCYIDDIVVAVDDEAGMLERIVKMFSWAMSRG